MTVHAASCGPAEDLQKDPSNTETHKSPVAMGASAAPRSSMTFTCSLFHMRTFVLAAKSRPLRTGVFVMTLLTKSAIFLD